MELLLAPLDRVRWNLYRALGPFAGPYARNRDLRVGVLGLFAVCIAATLALAFPLWTLALSPLLMGVPHVVADLRYLWVKPGYQRVPALWILVVVPIALGGVTGHAYWACLAAAGSFAWQSRSRRRLVAILCCSLLGVSMWHAGAWADLLFAHAHNFIALLLFWMLRPRGILSAWQWVPLLAFGSGCLLILFSEAPLGSWSAPLSGPSFRFYAITLAPRLEPEWAMRWITLFAFAQSVHYGIWLRLIPENQRHRAPRTFVSSYRALKSDFGSPLLVVAILTAALFAIWGTFDLAQARNTYLRFAVFHGHLEVAALALLVGARWERGASA